MKNRKINSLTWLLEAILSRIESEQDEETGKLLILLKELVWTARAKESRYDFKKEQGL